MTATRATRATKYLVKVWVCDGHENWLNFMASCSVWSYKAWNDIIAKESAFLSWPLLNGYVSCDILFGAVDLSAFEFSLTYFLRNCAKSVRCFQYSDVICCVTAWSTQRQTRVKPRPTSNTNDTLNFHETTQWFRKQSSWEHSCHVCSTVFSLQRCGE